MVGFSDDIPNIAPHMSRLLMPRQGMQSELEDYLSKELERAGPQRTLREKRKLPLANLYDQYKSLVEQGTAEERAGINVNPRMSRQPGEVARQLAEVDENVATTVANLDLPPSHGTWEQIEEAEAYADAERSKQIPDYYSAQSEQYSKSDPVSLGSVLEHLAEDQARTQSLGNRQLPAVVAAVLPDTVEGGRQVGPGIRPSGTRGVTGAETARTEHPTGTVAALLGVAMDAEQERRRMQSTPAPGTLEHDVRRAAEGGRFNQEFEGRLGLGGLLNAGAVPVDPAERGAAADTLHPVGMVNVPREPGESDQKYAARVKAASDADKAYAERRKAALESDSLFTAPSIEGVPAEDLKSRVPDPVQDRVEGARAGALGLPEGSIVDWDSLIDQMDRVKPVIDWSGRTVGPPPFQNSVIEHLRKTTDPEDLRYAENISTPVEMPDTAALSRIAFDNPKLEASVRQALGLPFAHLQGEGFAKHQQRKNARMNRRWDKVAEEYEKSLDLDKPWNLSSPLRGRQAPFSSSPSRRASWWEEAAGSEKEAGTSAVGDPDYVQQNPQIQRGYGKDLMRSILNLEAGDDPDPQEFMRHLNMMLEQPQDPRKMMSIAKEMGFNEGDTSNVNAADLVRFIVDLKRTGGQVGEHDFLGSQEGKRFLRDPRLLGLEMNLEDAGIFFETPEGGGRGTRGSYEMAANPDERRARQRLSELYQERLQMESNNILKMPGARFRPEHWRQKEATKGKERQADRDARLKFLEEQAKHRAAKEAYEQEGGFLRDDPGEPPTPPEDQRQDFDAFYPGDPEFERMNSINQEINEIRKLYMDNEWPFPTERELTRVMRTPQQASVGEIQSGAEVGETSGLFEAGDLDLDDESLVFDDMDFEDEDSSIYEKRLSPDEQAIVETVGAEGVEAHGFGSVDVTDRFSRAQHEHREVREHEPLFTGVKHKESGEVDPERDLTTKLHQKSLKAGGPQPRRFDTREETIGRDISGNSGEWLNEGDVHKLLDVHKTRDFDWSNRIIKGGHKLLGDLNAKNQELQEKLPALWEKALKHNTFSTEMKYYPTRRKSPGDFSAMHEMNKAAHWIKVDVFGKLFGPAKKYERVLENIANKTNDEGVRARALSMLRDSLLIRESILTQLRREPDPQVAKYKHVKMAQARDRHSTKEAMQNYKYYALTPKYWNEEAAELAEKLYGTGMSARARAQEAAQSLSRTSPTLNLGEAPVAGEVTSGGGADAAREKLSELDDPQYKSETNRLIREGRNQLKTETDPEKIKQIENKLKWLEDERKGFLTAKQRRKIQDESEQAGEQGKTETMRAYHVRQQTTSNPKFQNMQQQLEENVQRQAQAESQGREGVLDRLKRLGIDTGRATGDPVTTEQQSMALLEGKQPVFEEIAKRQKMAERSVSKMRPGLVQHMYEENAYFQDIVEQMRSVDEAAMRRIERMEDKAKIPENERTKRVPVGPDNQFRMYTPLAASTVLEIAKLIDADMSPRQVFTNFIEKMEQEAEAESGAVRKEAEEVRAKSSKAMERGRLRQNSRLEIGGQIFGFAIAVCSFLTAGILIAMGRPLYGMSTMVAAVAGLSGLFMWSRVRSRQKRETALERNQANPES